MAVRDLEAWSHGVAVAISRVVYEFRCAGLYFYAGPRGATAGRHSRALSKWVIWRAISLMGLRFPAPRGWSLTNAAT